MQFSEFVNCLKSTGLSISLEQFVFQLTLDKGIESSFPNMGVFRGGFTVSTPPPPNKFPQILYMLLHRKYLKNLSFATISNGNPQILKPAPKCFTGYAHVSK